MEGYYWKRQRLLPNPVLTVQSAILRRQRARHDFK